MDSPRKPRLEVILDDLMAHLKHVARTTARHMLVRGAIIGEANETNIEFCINIMTTPPNALTQEEYLARIRDEITSTIKAEYPKEFEQLMCIDQGFPHACATVTWQDIRTAASPCIVCQALMAKFRKLLRQNAGKLNEQKATRSCAEKKKESHRARTNDSTDRQPQDNQKNQKKNRASKEAP